MARSQKALLMTPTEKRQVIKSAFDRLNAYLESKEQDNCASQPKSQQREVFQSSRRTLVNERHRQHPFTRFEECRKRSQHSSPRTHLALRLFQSITSQDIHESDSQS